MVGCQIGPNYEQPDVDITCDWQSPKSPQMTCESPECYLWWKSLNDPILDSLLERAAMQNLDLYIAATRILEARAELKGKSLDLYPHIDASAGYYHVYYSKDALVNGLLGTAIPISPDAPVKRNVDFFEMGFDAEWEIDLFGITKHEMCALKAKAEASKEGLCDLWITLSGEIARNYIEMRGLQQRLQLIDKNIKAQKDTLELTNVLLRKGMVNNIDQKQVEQQLSLLMAEKPSVQLGIEKAIHRISVLLGYNPGDLYCELSEIKPLPQLPCDMPIGLPSELLRRRPDIRQAEYQLESATELIGAAVASLFPRLSLRGFIGDISTQWHKLGNPATATWAAGPQLLMPIFNSRLIEQDINFNKIKTREAFYEYQKKVLEALEETENAIASLHYDQERFKYLTSARAADNNAYDLTMALYKKGLKNYLEVLVNYRSLLSSEDALIQSQVTLLNDYIALYKSLGGGWELGDCPVDEECYIDDCCEEE
jgi:NodT family efflux transporter outer membrane factor (OMF) lipoprotein